MELLSSYHCTKFRLFVNCRNTIQIGTYSAKASGVDLGEFIKENGEEVQIVTIQGYKGLDAKIVILIDVDKIHEENYSKYIYIAATRARTLLYIVGSAEFWDRHNIS